MTEPQPSLHFVNLWQTQEERRIKYHLVRSLGLNVSWAQALRDWPLSKLERRLNIYFTTRSGRHILENWSCQLLLPGFTLEYTRSQKCLP